MTIRTLYSCKGCGLVDAPCEVPARVDEDAVTWMDKTVALISAEHRRRSPHCRANAMQELKIPMTGTQRVGGPSVS